MTIAGVSVALTVLLVPSVAAAAPVSPVHAEIRDTTILVESVDLYDPATGAHRGTERTWYGPDGRRLRQVNTEPDGTRSLVFLLVHDAEGHEVEGVYLEGDGADAALGRETFALSDDGRLKTTTYFSADGSPADRTESDLDADGREFFKRYFRADGTQYGEEDVLWRDDGLSAGWTFRYLERDDSAAFRYDYRELDGAGGWLRRVRLRNGTPERLEVRTVERAVTVPSFVTPSRFAPEVVSTEASETSPSFTADGRTMVFARYGDEWGRKRPFIARFGDEGWMAEPLEDIGELYNLAISPDGTAIFFATVVDEVRTLQRVRATDGGWSAPENLTNAYGLAGTYPAATDGGDLFFFDAQGPAGAGIYRAEARGDGFGRATPVFVPDTDDPFDASPIDGARALLVTRCFDDACASGTANGVWRVALEAGAAAGAAKLPRVPYVWGAQHVDALGLLVATDGDDILAFPASVARERAAPVEVDGGADRPEDRRE